jgi:hypothetical protein
MVSPKGVVGVNLEGCQALSGIRTDTYDVPLQKEYYDFTLLLLYEKGGFQRRL